MSIYSVFILFLLFFLYYSISNITYDSFIIQNEKSKRKAVDGIKKRKQILKDCKKDNIVVVVKSIDSDYDKKIARMIREKFSPALVTVVTFKDQNLIKDFLAKVSAETVETFPAYFRINTSDSLVQHLNIVNDKPNIIQSIEMELDKYKSKKNRQKEKEKEKEKDKKDKDKKDKDKKKGKGKK
jgi:hypothetical protein